MNPLNLSPVAQEFWSSIIRHVLTGVAGVLVTHGYVTQTGAQLYVEELVGVVLYGAGQAWSTRAMIWNRLKFLTALWMPKGATENTVDLHIASGNATPSVLTPPNTAPGVPAMDLSKGRTV